MRIASLLSYLLPARSTTSGMPPTSSFTSSPMPAEQTRVSSASKRKDTALTNSLEVLLLVNAGITSTPSLPTLSATHGLAHLLNTKLTFRSCHHTRYKHTIPTTFLCECFWAYILTPRARMQLPMSFSPCSCASSCFDARLARLPFHRSDPTRPLHLRPVVVVQPPLCRAGLQLGPLLGCHRPSLALSLEANCSRNACDPSN